MPHSHLKCETEWRQEGVGEGGRGRGGSRGAGGGEGGKEKREEEEGGQSHLKPQSHALFSRISGSIIHKGLFKKEKNK